jgi:uncharacterized protein
MAMIRHKITLEPSAVAAICRKYKVQSLFVFGSVLRDDFGPDSDVDFLVRLEPGVPLRLENVLNIEEELSRLVRRRVDIVLGSEIDAPEANPFRKRHILSTMEPLYVA